MPAFVLCSVCQTQVNLLAVVSDTSPIDDYYHCSKCKRVWTTPKGSSEPPGAPRDDTRSAAGKHPAEASRIFE